MTPRFFIDPITGLPHLYHHNVTEQEAIDVLEYPVEDGIGKNDARVAIGQTRGGRYLRVIYVPDDEPDGVFIITAYDLKGKPLAAFKRRRGRKS